MRTHLNLNVVGERSQKLSYRGIDSQHRPHRCRDDASAKWLEGERDEKDLMDDTEMGFDTTCMHGAVFGLCMRSIRSHIVCMGVYRLCALPHRICRMFRFDSNE